MEKFEKLIGEGGFVEHAKFGGNRYGTSKAMIREMTAGGRIVVLDIEMEVCLPVFLCFFLKIAGKEPWLTRGYTGCEADQKIRY